MARERPSPTDPVAPGYDEASTIRAREEGEAGRRPRQESTTEVRASGASKRSPSGPRPAAGSLDDRLEKKLQLATELTKELLPGDARVRLLHVAVMRRDEALLDGVLAELNKAPPSR
jgi:hypothetical protein